MKKFVQRLLLIILVLSFSVSPIQVEAKKKVELKASKTIQGYGWGSTIDDVVSFACSFAPNPNGYVYGGEKLDIKGKNNHKADNETAIDCSAFIGAIWREFGIKFNRTAKEFYNACPSGFKRIACESFTNTHGVKGDGTKEKYEKGDIIVWDGHVGMITGEGGDKQLIHAQWSKSGIVQTKVTSGKPPMGIVRFTGEEGVAGDNIKNIDDSGSNGKDWCTVTMKQGGVGHSSGCTVVTQQLILQNSGELKDNQLEGSITSRTKKYEAFDTSCANAGIQSGDSWMHGAFADGASKLCSSKWDIGKAVDVGKKSSKEVAYTGSVKAIVGFGKKDFKNMSISEQITAMKAFWNAGYFVTFNVEYKGYKQESNGPSEYKAAHATMLAGVKKKKIFINNPASGEIEEYSEDKRPLGKESKPYNLMYVTLFKNDKTSPLELSGKRSGSDNTKANSDEEDEKNAENLGVPMNMINGLYSEADLSSYTRMAEVDISEMFLDNAVRENLNQNEVSNLTNWERNIDNDTEEKGLLGILRIFTMIIGIVFTIWSILIYIAYWFDKLNNFFDINILGILTFGKLRVSEDENSSTFTAKSLGQHTEATVNHRNILMISVVGVVFGALIISGALYKAISGLVNLVIGIFD